jgi:ADP-ribose pyrophosphatase YjhB (NUDIX family)
MEQDKKILIKCRAVIFNEGKLLVVRHPGYPDNLASLPGGHLEWGEDPHECVSREIFEELGVKPEVGRLLYVHTFTTEQNQHYVEFLFEVVNGNEYIDISNQRRSHAHEIVQTMWVSPDDPIKILPTKFWEDFKTNQVLQDMPRFFKH